MRKRARPDWPILIYKYWVEPVGDIPQPMWDTAKQMQRLWNDLVQLRHNVQEELNQQSELDPKKKKERWQLFDDEIKGLIKSSGLNWECQGEIGDRFATTCRSGKHPKVHHRLDKIAIPHRFTGGGRPVAKIFTSASSYIGLQAIDAEAYESDDQESRRKRISKGYFGLGKEEKIDFRIKLHRPMPDDGVVKKVSWIGNRDTFGWRWSVAITVEMPPSKVKSVISERICGIDFGWRKFDDYLRVALLVDTDGTVLELRLPFDASTSDIRRYNKRYPNNRIIGDWREISEADSRVGNLVEALKDKLRQSLPDNLPDDIQASVSQLTKMRQGGLLRLLKQLEMATVADKSRAEIVQWREENDQLRRRIAAAKTRIIARRRWIYENFAVWLASNYSSIVWEGDLNVKQIAESDSNEHAIKAAQGYRHFAAISELRQAIKKACEKQGIEIKPCKSAGTTSICSICGSVIEPSAKLMLKCEKEHEWDQDINAAINMIKEVDAAFVETKQVTNIYKGKHTNKIKISEQLQAFLTKV